MPSKDATFRGFTLIELLVTLAILAAAFTIITPLFTKGVSTAELKSSARQIASALRATRSEAISKNQPALFVLNLKEKHFIVADQPAHSFAQSIDIELKTAESEMLDQDRGGIRFFPDGSSTGGSISLTNSEREINIGVEWLTGRVEILD